MKKMKLLVGLVMALLILSAVSAPTVSAQALNDVWLKCKITGKGYVVDPQGAYSKGSGSSTVYLHFFGTRPYNIEVWTEVNGVWDKRFTSTPVDTLLPGENFIPDLKLTFKVSPTDQIDVDHNPFIKISYINGNITNNVSYDGTGKASGNVSGGTFYGTLRVKGCRAVVDKLPFPH
jgi:hypothetical protein